MPVCVCIISSTARLGIDSSFLITQETQNYPQEEPRIYFLGLNDRSTIRLMRRRFQIAIERTKPEITIYHYGGGDPALLADLDGASHRILDLTCNFPNLDSCLQPRARLFDGILSVSQSACKIAQKSVAKLGLSAHPMVAATHYAAEQSSALPKTTKTFRSWLRRKNHPPAKTSGVNPANLPIAERATLITPLAGFVEELLIQENQPIQAQQSIAQLRSPALEEEIARNRQKIEEEKAHFEDLDALLFLVITAANAENSLPTPPSNLARIFSPIPKHPPRMPNPHRRSPPRRISRPSPLCQSTPLSKRS